MKYLVFQPGFKPFQTEYFDPENHWVEGMVVVNTYNFTHMTQKGVWVSFSDTKADHL